MQFCANESSDIYHIRAVGIVANFAAEYPATNSIVCDSRIEYFCLSVKRGVTFILFKKLFVNNLLTNSTRKDSRGSGADYRSTGYKLYTEPDASYTDIYAIEFFFFLWQSINGTDLLDKKPFVFVYEFELIEKPFYFI
jgi:hypothetical protein